MNREEIRKKWKNRELAEISQKKLVRQEDTQVSPTKNVSQGSSWERVQNRVNQSTSTWDRVMSTANKIANTFNQRTQPYSKTNISVDIDKYKQMRNPETTQNNLLNNNTNVLNVLDKTMARNNYQPPSRPTEIVETPKQTFKIPKIDKLPEKTVSNEELENLSQMNDFERNKFLNKTNKNKKEVEKINNQVKNYIVSKNAQENAQKINSDISNGDYGSAIYHILSGLPREALNATTKTVGAVSSLRPGQENLANVTKAMTKGYQETTSQIENPLVRTGAQVTGAVGNMIPGIASNIVAPGSGIYVNAVNVGTSEYLSTLNEEQTNKLQAILTGVAKGAVSKKVEELAGGNIFSEGSFDDVALNGIAKIKSDAVRWLASKGYEVGGEVAEENIENLIGYAIDSIINNEDITAEQLASDFKETSKDTALTTLFLDALGLGGNTYRETTQGTINNIIEESNLSDAQKEILTETAEKNGLSKKEVEYLIDNTKNGKYEQNQPTTIENKPISEQQQQTIQQEGKQAQNQLSSQIGEKEQKALNLRQSIDNFNNSRTEGQEIFDINNEETRKEIESIQKIAQDRNINIIFDENRFKNSNENAFYEYDKNNNVANIVLNPNSTSKKYVQNLVIHEMTHSFEGSKEYNNLSKAILDYAKSKGEYDSAFKDLMNTYSKVYSGENLNEIVEKEAVANILGEKLGDKEFVDSLVNNQYVERSTIQKIIDFIKNQINRFRGYKDQEQYWNNVKTLFEDAYNKSEISKGEAKYSFGGESAKTANVSTLKQAQKLKKQGLSNEEIYQQTGWFEGNEGKWRFEIDNSKNDITLDINEVEDYYRKGGYSNDYAKKITDVLKADELYEAYPKLKDIVIEVDMYPDDKSTLAYVEQRTDSKGNPEPSNIIYVTPKGLESLKTSADEFKSILLHELQHHIQQEEGFSRGASPQEWLSNKRNDILKRLRSITKEYIQKELRENNVEHIWDIKDSTIRTNLYKMEYLAEDSMSKYAKDPEDFELNYVQKRGLETTLGEEKTKEFYKILDEMKDYRTWDKSFAYYRNTAGEIEAREVQNRRNMTPEERKAKMPFIKDENTVYAETGTGNYVEKVTSVESTKDSQGRELSKGQQEYFKDSIVRDNKGNLKTLYHGTDAEFTVFNYDYLGKNGTANGKGFYLADDINVAKSYTGENERIIEAYADIQKPLSIGETTISENEYIKFLEAVNEATNGNLFTDYGDGETIKKGSKQYNEIIQQFREEYSYGGDDVDLVLSVLNGANISLEDGYRLLRNTLGYDGIIVETDYRDDNGKVIPYTQYIPLTPEQIKNTSNLNPTTNPDIRFSQETQDAWNNFIEKYFKNEGTGTAIKDMKKLPEMSITKYQEVLDNAKYIPQEDKQNLLSYLEDIKKNKSSLDDFKKIVNDLNENYRLSIDTEQQPVEQTVKEEKINLIPTKKIESEQTKQRKHYESIMKSSETSKEAKSIAKKLLGTDTYVPDSNKAQLERADQRIGANPDNELNVLTSKIDNGDRLNATDIAVSERLIEYYSKVGDLEKLETAIQNTALAGTQLGQSVQALSLINRQTPVGQVTYIERTIKKLNQEILNNKGYTQNSEGKILNKKGEDVTDKVELFNFTSEMQQKILNSNKDNIDKVLDEVYDELGNQVTKSTHQKIDSWRYFSMLSNIRTHLRNIVGNFAMGKTQQVKNLISAGVEDVSGVINPKFERTKTLRRSDKITKEFAKNDIKNVASELGLNSNKYTAQNRLKDNMREFKSDALNSTLGKLYNLNNTLLEVEDGWGLKSAYVRAFSNYITANKLDVKNISDTNLRKARKYAINEAQEATFHQASALASAINQFSARTKAGKAVTDAVLPFVKTPINVAKTGLEYNPAGLVYNSVKGIHDLNTGKITVNQYIDNISKGLTGTGISLLGYALAEAGIVKASGGDDDKEKYEKDRGSQAYSIKIGDNTYSLDWLAPVGIPFFVGVEAHDIIKAKKEQKNSKSTDDDSLYKQGIQSATNILNAFATSMNPMAEMSMLSGLTSALRSYEQGVAMFGSLMANAGKSYINQFVPTAVGQIARVTDNKQRSTTSTSTGVLGKAVDQTKNQIMAKIPGLRQKLPVATDIWGEELKNDDNITRRAFETFIAPYTRKDLKTSRLDSELNDLYDKTGESSIYPSKLKKDLTIDNEPYRFTNEEYIKYSKDYGQNSYNILSNLVTSNGYQNLSDSDKQKAIEKAYEYAKEVNKVNYAKKINKEDTVETDALYNVMSNIPSDSEKGKYLVYLVETSGDDVKDTEKKSYLLNSNMKDSTKEVIYRNSLGKKDKLYNTLYDIDKVNINGYLDYSSRDIKSDPDEESNVEGDTIYGTKKINVANALNEISNLSLFDKLYIYGKSYKLDSNERKIVDNGIKNSNLTQEEKDEAYKDLSKSNIIKYKDGSYKWK